MADPAEIMDQMFGGESAKNRFISSTLDPQKSQRAVELEKETGIDSEAISNDVDDIDQFHKKNLAKYIIENNTKLQGYIDSHPMAAGVSQNDLGQLDRISKKIDGLDDHEEDEWSKFGPVGDMQRIFWEGYGEGPVIGGWVPNNPNNFNEDGTLKYPYLTAVASGLGAFIEVPMRAFGGVLEVGKAATAGIYSDITGDETGGRQLARDLGGVFESYMGTHMGRTLNAGKFNASMRGMIQKTGLDAAAQLYFDSGKPLPVGLSKEADAAIERVSKAYWKKIDEVAAEADKSETKELNPDFFKTFAEKHPNIAGLDVLVDAEAVKRLYGDKEPIAGDNILGFMDALPSLLRVNEAIDVPIRISMAEWIAKVPSEVRKELHDDAKIKPGSVSKVEAEGLKDWNELDAFKAQKPKESETPVEVPSRDNEALRTVRQTSGLEPTSEIFDNIKDEHKYEVKQPRLKRTQEPYSISFDEDSGEFRATLPNGKVIGTLLDAFPKGKGEKAAFTAGSEVNEAYRRQGVASKLYEAFAERHEGNISPAGNTSSDAWAFWASHFPDKLIEYLHAEADKIVADIKSGDFPPEYKQEASKGFNHPEVEALINEIIDTKLSAPTADIKAERKYGADKLKLARMDEAARQDLDINPGYKDAFDITDEKGNVVGTLQGMVRGTNFFVDWVSSRAWAQSFGPRQVRSLIEELKREYPQIETVSGYRVSGAREKSGKEDNYAVFKLEASGDWTIVEATPEEGKWETFARGSGGEKLEGLVKPKKLWTDNELKIRDIVNKVIDKLGPKDQKRGVVSGLRTTGGNTQSGVFITFDKVESLVLVSLASRDPIATAAHEAGHALKKSGAFSEAEWDTLTERVLKGDGDKGTWIDQYQIKQRYGDTNKATQIEEAVMHKFGDYVSGKWMPEAGPIREMFERLKEIITQIRLGLKEAFGRELSAEDIFEKARIGGYSGRRPLTQKAEYVFKPSDVVAEIKSQRPSQPELPGLTRVEDQEAFKKGMDLGMTQKMLKQYMAAIEASREIDRKAIEDKALEFERKKQTKWWKDEAAKLEPEVQAELESLPDFQANEFFRTGLYGEEKLSKLPKLNPEFIDEDTLPGIPEKYLSEKGMHPDDVAGLLGINTGRALVGMLADFAEAQGDLQHAKFVDKLVRGEVDRRMEKAHGPLSENIIDWAQDHVLNNGQLELIHQEVLAAALRAGKSELPLSKKDIEAAALDKFRQLSIGSISTESALRSLGKAQRQAVMALLDGDPVAALKHEQDRMMQFFIAREAKKLEKAGKSFMRNAERFSEREVTNFPQVYTNWIHDILMKMNTGKLNFFMEDWQKRIDIEAGGVGKESLWDFVSYKMQNDMLEIAYDDRLFDDRLRTDPVKKDFEDLTVEEFYKGHGFLKSMIHNGRMEARGDKIMEGMTHDKVVVDLVNQIALSPAKPIENAKGERVMLGGVVPLKAANIIRRAGVAHLQWEAIANRIDRGDPHGPFSTYVMRPLIEAANYVHPLEKKYAAMLKDMDKAVREKYGKQNLKEKIENTLFHEPLDKYTDPADQRPMNMTRENLRAVMLYWGSETGREKLSRGYGAHPDDIQAWIDDNATKADYMWAQEYWKVRKALKAEVDVMYQNIAGAPPEDLRLAKWVTPFGDTIEGGYHPLRPHPNADMTKFGAADTFKDGLIRQNFFRATTANGHVMRRTGAVYPLDVGLDSIGTTFKQQIYDLAMRPGLIEASKYLNDDRVRIALGRHMGKEYVDMIKPYLGDVANAMNEEGTSAYIAMRVFNAFRSNVIGTLVGFNPGTVLKHGPTALVQSVYEVGAGNFARAMFNLWGRDHDSGKSNWKFAVETSEELQRRERNYQETLQGFNSSMLGKRPLREKFMQVAAWPVAKSDMISAVPTWLAQYEKSMVEGLTHGDSVYMADRAVRRAHGSTAVTNRPEVMRGGMAMGALNPVYGFFSHILNRQYEMAWKAKDLAGETKRGEVSPADFAKRSGVLAGMLTAYIIAPSIIEELVSPLPAKEDEGPGEKISKMLAFSVASSWIGIRDIAHFAIAGFNPSGIGVAGPAMTTTRDVINDLSSREGKAFDETNVGRSLKHLAILSGMLTGIPNAQIGRWAQLAWEYSIDKDAPDDFWTWAVALRFGQLKGHSRTPDEYAEHIMGAH